MKHIADVIIVGAGIAGCSAAFHLARQGNPRVIVVEKGALGSGMTKRSGAMIYAHTAHYPEAQLAAASLELFQNWEHQVGGHCGLTPTGFAVVASERDAAQVRANVTQMLRAGIHAQTLAPDALRVQQPFARVDDLALAAFEPDAGFIDPMLATQSLAARAKDRGVEFRTGTLVKSIRVENGRVAGVTTTTGTLDALTVVIMAGAWSPHLLAPLGVELAIRAARAQVMFYERPAELKSGHIAFDDWTTGTHFRPHPFGLTMGGLDTASDNANPDQPDETIAPSHIADVQQRIAARLPAMAHARYLRGHAGVYDLTPNARPIISRVPGMPGLIVAAGLGRQGMTLAPAIGACVAEMIADGEAHTADIAELSLSQ